MVEGETCGNGFIDDNNLAHTSIAEHSHTNPEHNGPEAVRAYYARSMSMIYAKRG